MSLHKDELVVIYRKNRYDDKEVVAFFPYMTAPFGSIAMMSPGSTSITHMTDTRYKADYVASTLYEAGSVNLHSAVMQYCDEKGYLLTIAKVIKNDYKLQFAHGVDRGLELLQRPRQSEQRKVGRPRIEGRKVCPICHAVYDDNKAGYCPTCRNLMSTVVHKKSFRKPYLRALKKYREQEIFIIRTIIMSDPRRTAIDIVKEIREKLGEDYMSKPVSKKM